MSGKTFCCILAGFSLALTVGQTSASPYTFTLERVSLTTVQGTSVEEFNGSTLGSSWQIGDPTVSVSGGVVTLSSPGELYSDTVNGVPLWFEGTYFESTFKMEDGQGDFTAIATWTGAVPGTNQHYNVSLDAQSGAVEVAMVFSNFDSAIAAAAGVPAGPAIWFGTSTEGPGGVTTSYSGQSIDPAEITGAILMRASFDDTLNQLAGSFSLDGGGSFQSPFSAVSFVPSGSKWGFGAESVSSVPIPAAFWLLGSAIGLAGLSFSRRRVS